MTNRIVELFVSAILVDYKRNKVRLLNHSSPDMLEHNMRDKTSYVQTSTGT